MASSAATCAPSSGCANCSTATIIDPTAAYYNLLKQRCESESITIMNGFSPQVARSASSALAMSARKGGVTHEPMKAVEPWGAEYYTIAEPIVEMDPNSGDRTIEDYRLLLDTHRKLNEITLKMIPRMFALGDMHGELMATDAYMGYEHWEAGFYNDTGRAVEVTYKKLRENKKLLAARQKEEQKLLEEYQRDLLTPALDSRVEQLGVDLCTCLAKILPLLTAKRQTPEKTQKEIEKALTEKLALAEKSQKARADLADLILKSNPRRPESQSKAAFVQNALPMKSAHFLLDAEITRVLDLVFPDRQKTVPATEILNLVISVVEPEEKEGDADAEGAEDNSRTQSLVKANWPTINRALLREAASTISPSAVSQLWSQMMG